MSLDFREEYKTVYAYLAKRVADFGPSSNSGPGDVGEPLRQINFGYQPDIEMEELAEYFGVMLRDALIEACDAGVLAELPPAPDCAAGIEEHEGNYGWPGYENRDEGRIGTPA
jgi:hypothetical protein